MSSIQRKRPAKTSRNAEATKRIILDAALREFADRGLAGARMDEIARLASVNKALLYYYFQGKEWLFAGVVHRAFLTITDALEAALLREASPPEKLLAFLDANFNALASQPLLARLLSHEIDLLKFVSSLSDKALFERDFLQRVGPLLAEFREMLASGVRSGEFRELDVDAVFPLLIMIVRTAARGMPMGGQFLPGFQALSPERRRAAAIDLIKAAVFAEPLRPAVKSKSAPRV